MKTLDKTKLVKIEDVVEFLKSDSDHEHEFTHYLGGMLRSTYWMEYKSAEAVFALSTDWSHYEMFSESELFEYYAGHWWNLTCC